MHPAPLFAFALSLLAAHGFAQQQPSAIEQSRQRALADSNDPAAHYDLAMALWEKKRWEAADSALRTAIRIAPTYADAYLALGALGEARGEKYWKNLAREKGDSAAMRALLEMLGYNRKAFQLNPLVSLKPIGKYEGPASVMSFGGMSINVTPSWMSSFNKGVNALIQGNYPEAFRLVNRVANDSDNKLLAQSPHFVVWYHALAAAHVDSFDIAITNFAELTRRAEEYEVKHPDQAEPMLANDYRYLASSMLYLAGRYQEALNGFTEVLENDLSHYVAHVQMARIYEASNMPDDALTERRRALDANPDDSSLMVELAVALMQNHGTAEATELLSRAEALNPRDPRIPFLRGAAAVETGDAEGARRSFNRFLAIAPSSYGDQIARARSALQSLP